MKNGRRNAVLSTLFSLVLLMGLGRAVTTLRGRPSIPTRHDGSPWGADYFPNVSLVTQDGKPVRFFEDLIRGRVVAINFIYTGCAQACPLETARLREVQKILGDRVGRDVFFYSISIDPEHDTPEVLKAYAKQFDAGPGWTFLTGKEADITKLRKKLGLLEDESQARNLKGHDLSLIIGNQVTGQWMLSSPYENPYVLATELGSWLPNWKTTPKKRHSYAEAPELRPMSDGEILFRTRCEACHSIGNIEMVSGKKPVGPDLSGILRQRDRQWLTRWLKEPDKMLAEKDPLAMALFDKYNHVTMPNLSLNDADIEALLHYIQGESR